MGFHDSRRTSGAPSAGGFAADSHFLNHGARGYASNDGSEFDSCTESGESGPCHFSVFRADSVSVTSTRFAGGDWRWRLSEMDGAILVEAGGYRSEAHCRRAVAILQARAAHATIA